MLDAIRPKTPKIIAIANQKGGVGKTTTAINLGAALVDDGYNVLLVDLDPQGNASTGLGIEPDERTHTTYDLLLEDSELEDVILPTDIDGFWIAPATTDLSSADIEMVANEKRSFLLHDALRQPAIDRYNLDYILIDCPPSLSLLTVNAMVAAHSVLVPLQSEFFALEGLSQLMRTIDAVKAGLNGALSMQGIVLTMFDSRNKLSAMVANDVRDHFGELVYNTVVPRNVRVSEAPSFGQPVLIYDLKCPGSQAYAALAAELLRQEAKAA